MVQLISQPMQDRWPAGNSKQTDNLAPRKKTLEIINKRTLMIFKYSAQPLSYWWMTVRASRAS